MDGVTAKTGHEFGRYYLFADTEISGFQKSLDDGNIADVAIRSCLRHRQGSSDVEWITPFYSYLMHRIWGIYHPRITP